MIFGKVGLWFDKYSNKFFPPSNAELEFLRESAESGSGEVTDYRNMSDDEFLKHAKPDLEKLEELRHLKLKKYKARKKMSVPVCLITLPCTGFIDWILLSFQRGHDDSLAGVSILVAGIIYGWVTQPKREYTRAYKENILPKLARLFGQFIYDLKGKISMDKLIPSKILPSHDSYKSEDYFLGTYKGVGMEFAEIHLTEQQGSGKNRTTVTKFKGLCILLDMKSKKFLGHTTLQKNSGKVSEWFKEKSSKMKRARMADPEFEKMFDAYTTDQVEARYLIDPLVIEDLKVLQEEYKGQGLTAAWYQSQMLILISSSHNHFEPADIDVPATNAESVLNMKHEIGQILSLVDRLDLYDPLAIEEERQKEQNIENQTESV